MTELSPNLSTENPGPIVRGGTRGDIFEVATPGPMMRDAVRGWARPIQIAKVATKIVDGVAVESSSIISTTGTLQPMKARAIALKPEGQRAWRWFTLHTEVGLRLEPDDRVIVKGVPYRVMGRWDLSDFGYVKHELVEDYRNAPQS